MSEFWESTYRSNKEMWGDRPTDNAKHVLELFQKNKIKSVFIPGFGYGRNARLFYDQGIQVSGIEIAKTAIKRARRYFGPEVTIHCGSVTDMPFDDASYSSIYCYSLIHLLNPVDRWQFIDNCHSQLMPNGLMIFVALSINDKRFGVGEQVSKNTFQTLERLNYYFYDEEAVMKEFGKYNIIELKEINEPEENPNERHWMIVCKK